eukprot:6593653-Pyramimonas_sp.AAC.1
MLRILQTMYCEGATMSAEHLTNIVYHARRAGAAGPLESWGSSPNQHYKGAYVVSREIKRLRRAESVCPSMTIPVFGHIISQRRRGDLNLQVRAFHEMLHAELHATPIALQDAEGEKGGKPRWHDANTTFQHLTAYK